MQARGPAHGGRRGPFPPLPMGGKRSRASTPQPLGHGGAQARTSTPQPWPAYAGQVQKTKAPEGNRENEGHRTTPGFKPSPAAAGEGGGATGKGDGKGKGGGETRPTADAGDGKAAEGKGDVEGNDDPAGFQPSPADAGQGKGAKVNGDNKVQAKLGFKPSPANAKKTSEEDAWSAGDARMGMDASDRISNAGSGTVGFEHGGRTWRPPQTGQGDLPKRAASRHGRRSDGGGPAAARDQSTQAVSDSSWAQRFHTRPKCRAVPPLVDVPSSSTHGDGGKEGNASTSTDPFPMKQEAEGECIETKVKEMSDDALLALSRALSRDVAGQEYAELVGKEMHNRNLVVSHGVGLSVPVKDDQDDESSRGRPPSY